jgi:hypothetical protein
MRKVLVLAALSLVAAPAAEAKFTASVTVAPTPVWAKQPVRVTVRTEIVLPRQHGLELEVVGPWHPRYGNAFFEPPLYRTGPKTYKATVRFPRGGRWALGVPNWGGAMIKVQPSP